MSTASRTTARGELVAPDPQAGCLESLPTSALQRKDFNLSRGFYLDAVINSSISKS
jgi:hypothetical protein